jgi:hypothetical protein
MNRGARDQRHAAGETGEKEEDAGRTFERDAKPRA